MTATLSRPAHLWVPESTSTAGPEAADLAESAGMVPFPEQRLALDAILSERDGKWSAFEVAVVCGRQNLKTWVLEVAALYDVFLRNVDRVVWTAHLYKTTADSFQNLAAVCENADHLRRRVYKVYSGAGEQRIKLLPRHTGPSIDFMARSSGGGRGLSGDTVVLDEALFLTPAMMGALLPTLSSKADPVVRYGSSPGLASSDVLRAIRDRGRRGGDPSLAYVEWSSEESPCELPRCDHEAGTYGCALDNEDMWRQANPALGRRISLEYVRNERRALPIAEFRRERMGWWDTPGKSDHVIPVDDWAACRDPGSRMTGGIVLGIDVALDRSASWVVAAGSAGGDLVQFEVADSRPGTGWVADRVSDLLARHPVDAVAVVRAGPAASLVPDLQRACDGHGVPLETITTMELPAACGRFHDLATSRRLRHLGDDRVDAALAAADRHWHGATWSWERKGAAVDAAPLVAATVAVSLRAVRDEGAEPGMWVV